MRRSATTRLTRRRTLLSRRRSLHIRTSSAPTALPRPRYANGASRVRSGVAGAPGRRDPREVTPASAVICAPAPAPSTAASFRRASALAEGGADEALCMLRSIQARGVRADVVTYGTLVRDLCDTGEVDMDEMCEGSVEPNVVVYSCLLPGYCKSGWWQDIGKVFEEMS